MMMRAIYNANAWSYVSLLHVRYKKMTLFASACLMLEICLRIFGVPSLPLYRKKIAK